MAGPAFAPNNSVAICAASVSVFAPAIFSCISAMASFNGLPSFVAFCRAFLRPVNMVPVSMPDFSKLARNPVAVLIPKPISCRAGPLLKSDCVSLSNGTPVSCAALFKMSSTSPALSVSTLNAAIAACTESMLEGTSVPFNSANFRNFVDRSSNSSPVLPNRVLTSPTASPTVPRSATTLPATFLYASCRAAAASPVAPVLFVILSAPSSNSFQASPAAAAMSFKLLTTAFMAEEARSARTPFHTVKPSDASATCSVTSSVSWPRFSIDSS